MIWAMTGSSGFVIFGVSSMRGHQHRFRIPRGQLSDGWPNVMTVIWTDDDVGMRPLRLSPLPVVQSASAGSCHVHEKRAETAKQQDGTRGQRSLRHQSCRKGGLRRLLQDQFVVHRGQPAHAWLREVINRVTSDLRTS